MYVVIMAGGGGTRLRPLSTPERPKPFLPLLPTGETLLQRTVARLRGVELEGPGGASLAVFVVAAERYAALIASQVPGVPVIAEPEGRNTAAAIALAAIAIERADDDVMVVLPADHRIDPAREGVFRGVLRDAADGLAGGVFGIERPLVTLGVQATRAATEYGYLRPVLASRARILGLDAYPLLAFEEKPDAARAQVLRAEPGTAWNAGMFLWQRGAIRDALARHAPDVLAAVVRGLASGDLTGEYRGIPSRSIDYAVMEPAASNGTVVMASMDVGWSDVGTWSALLEVLGADGIAARVVEAGEAATAGPEDLLVERDTDALVVRRGTGGTMTSLRPVALLQGARDAEPLVQALLDRCAASEVRA